MRFWLKLMAVILAFAVIGALIASSVFKQQYLSLYRAYFQPMSDTERSVEKSREEERALEEYQKLEAKRTGREYIPIEKLREMTREDLPGAASATATTTNDK